MSDIQDTKCHTFSEPQARGDLNDDGNFRNGWDFGNVRNVENVKNFRNVRTDIKCHTFLKSQPRADSGHTLSVITFQKHKQ